MSKGLLAQIMQDNTWLSPKYDTKAHALTGPALEEAVGRFLVELQEFCREQGLVLSYEVPNLLRELATSSSPHAAYLALRGCQRTTETYDEYADRNGSRGYQPGRYTGILTSHLRALLEAAAASAPPQN